MALHKDLTGADLHEPKGQSTALVNTVYVADGSGSGTHKKIPVEALDTFSMESPNTFYINAQIDDISEAGSILIPVVDNSILLSAVVTLGGAITGADANISFTRNDAASMGTALPILFTGSAEGSNFIFTPTSNADISGPGYVKVATDGGSTGSVVAYISVKFSRNP